MADQSRLEDLRRRVEKDPASIAFAQLAEEYRRAGQLELAVEACRGGLNVHPGYLSARVTLGRALLELNQLDEAQHELEQVLHSAPENLAAIRGLAEIHHRRGHLEEALAQYRAALALAPNDPDLERTVDELAREVAPQPRAEPANGLSFDQIHEHLLAHVPAAAASAPPAGSAGQVSAALASVAASAGQVQAAAVTEAGASTGQASAPAAPEISSADLTPPADAPSAPPEGQGTAVAAALAAEVEPVVSASVGSSAPADASEGQVPVIATTDTGAASARVDILGPLAPVAFDALIAPVALVTPVARIAPFAPEYNSSPDATTEHAYRTIAALTKWLDALNVSCPDGRP